MELSPQQEDRLKELMDVFLEENSKLNLSAYRTEDQCWAGNIVDSVAGAEILEEFLESKESGNIMDIGTGGGFPLLPLAMFFPQISFTGLDATRKKIDAVGRICEKLSLTNVQLVTGRTEDVGQSTGQRERYDIVTSRAVSALPTLLEYMSPFVRVGGHLFCWKSMNAGEELLQSITARMTLKTRLVGRHEYDLPNDWGKRQILIFEKTGELSSEYPREVGVPKKEPLS